MEPITRSEQIMSAISGEYDGTIPTPITRGKKILAAIYNRIGGAGGSASPETVGQAMKEYVEQNPGILGQHSRRHHHAGNARGRRSRTDSGRNTQGNERRRSQTDS